MRKPGRASEIPPPLELECLKVLWALRQATVRQVHEAMVEHRGLAYTTVLTILDRLAKRGAVERRKAGRAFVYEPVLDREQARSTAVRELVNTHFGGSMDALREYLAGAPVAVIAATREERAGSLDTALL